MDGIRNKSNLTILISSLSGGGAEGIAVWLANTLNRELFNVEVVVLHDQGGNSRGKLNSNLVYKVLGSRVRYSLRNLHKYYRNNQTNIFFIFNYELLAVILLMKSVFGLGTPIVFRNINNISLELRNRPWLNRSILKLVFRYFGNRINLIIHQCTEMKLDFQVYLPGINVQHEVINNPIKMDYFRNEEVTRLTKSSKARKLLLVGRLEYQKGVDRAIKAFSLLKTVGLQLYIVGEGSLRNELEVMARDLGISEKVCFAGHINVKAKLYRESFLTLLSSRYEGYPNVLLESISSGTPVVSFDCQSGPNEIIINNLNGLLVPQDDIVAFSEAIDRALKIDWDPIKIRNSIIYKNSPLMIIEKYENALSLKSYE